MGIDVSEELKELWKVYHEANEHLEDKERCALDDLIEYMKKFIEVYDERNRLKEKIGRLNIKLKKRLEEDMDYEEERV